MFAVCVIMRLRPGARESFMPLMTSNAKASLEVEPGCHRFDVATDSADPDAVFLYELYDDKGAFDAHLETDHYQAFDAATADMVAEKTVVTWDTVVE
ncbi:putative quinol monooxygenase [Yoonia sp. 2307UL14-13]|uniref:putative quinol monooxygenase n=1 Tax=Yoonia sp. 2307UL14-13 TaxID=3126506 RepID=UPI0030B2EDD5